MESPDREHEDLSREAAKEQASGGRFDRKSGSESSVVEGSEAGPGATEIDEELEDRGDV